MSAIDTTVWRRIMDGQRMGETPRTAITWFPYVEHFGGTDMAEAVYHGANQLVADLNALEATLADEPAGTTCDRLDHDQSQLVTLMPMNLRRVCDREQAGHLLGMTCTYAARIHAGQHIEPRLPAENAILDMILAETMQYATETIEQNDADRTPLAQAAACLKTLRDAWPTMMRTAERLEPGFWKGTDGTVIRVTAERGDLCDIVQTPDGRPIRYDSVTPLKRLERIQPFTRVRFTDRPGNM